MIDTLRKALNSALRGKRSVNEHVLACLLAHPAYAYRPFNSTDAAVAARGEMELFHKPYWRFLAKPWKVVTFVIATLFFTFAGRFTIDFTWDYVTGGMMSVLAYVTAPWAVAMIWRLRNRFSIRLTWLVASVWLFSASWCYDLYLLWRDHGLH